MRLKKIKALANKSIKKLYNNFSAKSARFRKILLVALILTTIVVITFFIVFFRNLSVYLQEAKINKKYKSNNFLFNMAEKEYQKGFLENSAIYYQNYLSSNNKDQTKQEKIIAYKRLFDVAILQKNLDKALLYLEHSIKLEPNNPQYLLDKIKILLRKQEYSQVKKLITKNKNKLSSSDEFAELYGIYLLKIKKYRDALKQFSKIPFKRREFSVHYKIVLTYFYLNEITKGLNYLGKIDSKVQTFSDRNLISNFLFLRSIGNLFKNKIKLANEDLQRSLLLSKKNLYLKKKMLLLTSIMLDKPDSIWEIFKRDFKLYASDTNIANLVGAYFSSIGDSKRALQAYKILQTSTKLSLQDILLLADLNYKNNNFLQSIDFITKALSDYNYKTPLVYKNIAVNYRKIADISNEIFYLKEGLLQFPGDIDFYVRIAKAYIEQQNYTKALEFINKGKQIATKNSSLYYDKRLDYLSLLAMEKNNSRFVENDLLEFREKEIENADFYFKLIQFYLSRRQYSNAKREIDTVTHISMDQRQNNTLLIYKVIWSLLTDNYAYFYTLKSDFLKINQKNFDYNLNKALVYIFDADYDKAIAILNNLYNHFEINNGKINVLKSKILLIKAVAFYMKKNYTTAYKVIDELQEISPLNEKANFLKNLIYNEIEVPK